MRQVFFLFLLLLLLYALTFAGHLYSPDEEVMFRTTESLAQRGSLAIEPLMGFASREGVDKRQYAQYGIGQPIAAVPFYWLGGLLRRAASDSTWISLAHRLRTDPSIAGAKTPDALADAMAERLAVSSFNIFVTALAGVVLFLLARRLTGSTRAAWLAAFLWGAGSIAWPHGRTFFSEPLAGLCLLLCLELLACYFHPTPEGEGEPSPEWCLFRCSRAGTCGVPGYGCRVLPIFAGVLAGYGCLVRLDSVVFLPALTLVAVWGDFATENFAEQSASRKFALFLRHLFRLRVLMRLFFFALPVAAAGGIILGLNTLHFGSPFASAYSDQPEGIAFSTPILAGLYGYTMSIGRGLFFFSPVLVLCFWGFAPMVRRRPIFGTAIVLLVISFLLFQSRWRNWAGGWDWGPRHIIQIHALLAIPIAFWAAEKWNAFRRIAIICALLIGVAVQIYACTENPIEFYRIYYRSSTPPHAQIQYDLASNPDLAARYAVFLRDQQGNPAQQISLTDLPAPLNDSIYIVQNSAWPRYAEMLRVLHLHDNFWLHLMEKD